METHHYLHTARKKSLPDRTGRDPLFLGISNAVPCCFVGVLCGEHPGRYFAYKRSEDTAECYVIVMTTT